MSYQVPANPIPHHLAFGLGIGGGSTGLIALVLGVCTAIYDWPSAPATLTAICAAFLGASAMILWCADAVVSHQAACLEANRAASRAEVKQAQKLVQKILAQWQHDLDEREAMRMAAAFAPTPESHLRAVEGPHGMG